MTVSIDEMDFQLLHALQLAPRAPWAKLAQPLGVSAATAARRWARISAAGDAWISAYPATRAITGSALVDVTCDPEAVHQVGESIARSSRAVTVEELTGERDLLVLVRTRSLPELATYLARTRQLPGLRSLRTQVITTSFLNASHWRLDALDIRQRRAIQQLATTPPSHPARALDALDQQLSVALSRDGRSSATDLAEICGVGVNTVRRRIAQLVGSGTLEIRCDVSRESSGHEAAVTLWLSVQPKDLAQVTQSIAELPQVRVVVATTGTYNLVVAAWLRDASHVPDFEQHLTAVAPGVSISDRALVLRTIKHAGRILDDHGRARDVVPMDVWSPSEDSHT